MYVTSSSHSRICRLTLGATKISPCPIETPFTVPDKPPAAVFHHCPAAVTATRLGPCHKTSKASAAMKTQAVWLRTVCVCVGKGGMSVYAAIQHSSSIFYASAWNLPSIVWMTHPNVWGSTERSCQARVYDVYGNVRGPGVLCIQSFVLDVYSEGVCALGSR